MIKLRDINKTYYGAQPLHVLKGIDLDIQHKTVRQKLIAQEHCFTGCAGTNILRLLPPLCLTKAEADMFIEKLTNTLKTL